MKLHVINSNSAGNCYLLEADNGEVLMLECGVRWTKIREALGSRVSRVVGCLITHSHGDHCFAVEDVLKAGIPVYSTFGELDAMGIHTHHNAHSVIEKHTQDIGAFKVIPFGIEHDTPDPVGYLIYHDECGTTLFLTDSIYSRYTFPGLTNIIVEANYCEDILTKRLAAGEEPEKVRDRVIQSHMSINNCIDLLRANDLSQVNNIVLIHLSDRNSNEAQFVERVRNATGKTVTAANAGMTLNFDLTPY